MMKDKLPPDTDIDMTRGPLARDIELSQRRPEVPGDAAEYIYIPARGFMTGRVLNRDFPYQLVVS